MLVKNRKSKIGTVTSNKMEKTIVVKVDSIKTNRIYKKKYVVSKKFKAHDENSEFQIGDVVEIVEAKPYSKDKKFLATRKVK